MKGIFENRLLSRKRFGLPALLGAVVLAVGVSALVLAPRSFAAGSQEVAPAKPTAAVAPYPATNSIESQVEAVGKAAGPSVVNVTSTIMAQNFFSQPVPQEAVGSGFVYDNQGHIVTNYHVVKGASTVVVTLRSGKNYQAKVIGVDPTTDLAVLKISGAKLPAPLTLGDSSRVQVGQFVVALGNPFGLEHTLTFGVVSAKGRIIQSPNGRYIGEALQTDAPINPGNSGGPLITLAGDVIGVNSQIISSTNSSAGIGFAIPVNLVKRIVPQLISFGHAQHPYLGVSGIGLSPQLQSALKGAGVNVPASTGFMVASVQKGSPAAMAGVHGASQVVPVMNTPVPVGGDVIVAIDGKKVTDFQDLSAYLESEAHVGQTVNLTILRNGSTMNIPVKLGMMPQSLQNG